MGGIGGIWPSVVKDICPNQVHMFMHDFVSAGMFCMSKSGLPGIHGVVTAGRQGAGVKTPIAAEVAAITAGLVGAEHMPNEGMFVMGMKSMMLPCCRPPIITVRDGLTVRGQGAIPKVHVISAPVTTYESGIMVSLS